MGCHSGHNIPCDSMKQNQEQMSLNMVFILRALREDNSTHT